MGRRHLRLGLLALAACGGAGGADDGGRYDPLAVASAATGAVGNVDAAIPPDCFVRTDGGANRCWVCHTDGDHRGRFADGELQRTFPVTARAGTNPWRNLFVDRRPAIAGVSDAQIEAWIDTDNYAPLAAALAEAAPTYPGVRPDLDLAAGFDADGFAVDGSGWRAVRYQPFPATVGLGLDGLGDVFIRLPTEFRADRDGQPSPAVYRLNLSLLEAALTAPPPPATLDRAIEPVDERLLGFDLDGDGAVTAGAVRVRRLPPRYAGLAAARPLRVQVVPAGTELLHSVRYLDPTRPTQQARRMKELRYARKVEELDDWGELRAYQAVADERSEGMPPRYQGDAAHGFLTGFGWQLQGFIEDRAGRLRLQTDDEHRACLGCHGALGVTVDHTFSLARKVPGAAGWRPQDLRGLTDRPQRDHAAPELATYRQRAGLATADHPADLLAWLAPPPAAALELDKAYYAVVQAQAFGDGRVTQRAPSTAHHARIVDDDTGLAEADRIFLDGTLVPAW
ncbi:MAG: hypothetical protein R3B06_07695 [Kofleriaceae bacterium]